LRRLICANPLEIIRIDHDEFELAQSKRIVIQLNATRESVHAATAHSMSFGRRYFVRHQIGAPTGDQSVTDVSQAAVAPFFICPADPAKFTAGFRG
jgi:hypothetical protein